MTAHDHLVSGAIMLVLAALAWTVTPLPGMIVTAQAIVGGLLVLRALDEDTDAQM